jgi:hypothetical protein
MTVIGQRFVLNTMTFLSDAARQHLRDDLVSHRTMTIQPRRMIGFIADLTIENCVLIVTRQQRLIVIAILLLVAGQVRAIILVASSNKADIDAATCPDVSVIVVEADATVCGLAAIVITGHDSRPITGSQQHGT